MAIVHRTYTADFCCFNRKGKRDSAVMRKLLEKHHDGHAPAYALEAGTTEKYQIRSITRTKSEKVYMAVFGRLRHGETPEQATDDGDETDVALKPGHGLVEKNHFLFYTDLNLIVYQRNGSGSTQARLQRYLNQPTFDGINLEPVLTGDSYARLMKGGELKKVELSISPPQFTPADGEEFIQDAIDMFKSAAAGRMKVVLSAERGKTLSEKLRTPIATLARVGRTRVARVVQADDNEDFEVIDLIGDRIKETFTVPLEKNGRPTAQSVFAALAGAKDARNADLKAFFG